jgi:enoyl-CoA hydratase
MSEPIAVEEVDGLAVVRIQRPPANALEPGLLAAGADVVAKLRAERPRAVVITGAGDFFSGGVDLKLAPTFSPAEQRGMVAGINRLFVEWYGFPGPVVAAVNGHAVAGGMILALCADHRVGSRAGTYGLTEVKVGTPYPVAALAVVRAELAPASARRLVLGGELVDADTALELALVDELAAQADVLARAQAVAHELAALPSSTYRSVKAQLRGPDLEAMRTGIEDDPLAQGWLGEETADAARAALEP